MSDTWQHQLLVLSIGFFSRKSFVGSLVCEDMQAKEVVFVFLITHIIKEVYLLCFQGIVFFVFLLTIHPPVISIKYQIQVGCNLKYQLVGLKRQR